MPPDTFIQAASIAYAMYLLYHMRGFAASDVDLAADHPDRTLLHHAVEYLDRPGVLLEQTAGLAGAQPTVEVDRRGLLDAIQVELAKCLPAFVLLEVEDRDLLHLRHGPRIGQDAECHEDILVLLEVLEKLVHSRLLFYVNDGFNGRYYTSDTDFHLCDEYEWGFNGIEEEI